MLATSNDILFISCSVCVIFIGDGSHDIIEMLLRMALPGETADLPQVTDKRYHISCYEYTSPWMGIKLHI